MLSTLLLWLSLLVAIAPSVAAADEADLPSPSELDSHKAYGADLARQQSEAFDVLLTKYDEELAHEPNVVTAIERCRFILAAASDAEGWPIEGRAELGESCLEELATRYEDEPRAILYRAEEAFGDERNALIRRELVRQPPLAASVRAQLRKLLAESLENADDLEGAAREARLARKDNPGIDVSLILARHAHAHGQKAAAVQLLSEQLTHTEPALALNAKASLLADLQAYEVALRALELADLGGAPYRDAALHARVLEGLGRYDDARREYQLLLSSYHDRSDILHRLFELDLAHGSGEQAAASYAALRDAGYENDPGLRRRLSVFWAHPSLGLAASDLLGLLRVLALLAVVALIPLCVLLPVHYAGLVRRERGYPAVVSESRWTLPRVALLFGSYLALDVLTVYLFAPGLWLQWLKQPTRGHVPDHELAALVLVGAVLGLLVIGFAIGKRELREVLRVARDAAPKNRVLRAFRMVFAVALINGMLAVALGLSEKGPKVPELLGLISAQSMLTALLRSYGFSALVFVAVISAPLVEELLFRYALTDAVEKQLSFPWANRFQALIFALFHDSWAFWPTLFMLAVQAGKLRRETGSLRASVALHAGWNLLASLALLARSLR